MYLNLRRTFIKKSFLTTAVLVLSQGEVFAEVSPLQTLELVQEDLFPNTKETPTLQEVNASAYLTFILHHSHVTDTQKRFIRNGVGWLNEEALKLYNTLYPKLSPQQRQNVLKTIAKHRWGEQWIETLLTYIFEATLGDPLYGINKDQVGWKWLKHKGGEPRPKEIFS